MVSVLMVAATLTERLVRPVTVSAAPSPKTALPVIERLLGGPPPGGPLVRAVRVVGGHAVHGAFISRRAVAGARAGFKADPGCGDSEAGEWSADANGAADGGR